MSLSDVSTLVLLAAIWGSSFIFSRITAPVVGAWTLAEARLLIAALAFAVYFQWRGTPLFSARFRREGKHYFFVGLLNFAVPFAGFSFAALYIPAAYSAILNATVPFWGAVFASFLLGDRLTFRKILGLFLGAAGVTLVSGAGVIEWSQSVTFAILAGLLSAASYAASALYVRTRAAHLPPAELTGGGVAMGALMLAPVLFFTQVNGALDVTFWGSLLFLGLVCSALAFLLFYRLVGRIGTTPALLVTFLMPVFGMFWGTAFLAEQVTARMVLGALVILSGMALLLLRKSPEAAPGA